MNKFLQPLLHGLAMLPVAYLYLSYFGADLLKGVSAASFAAAVVGVLLYSACTVAIDLALERMFQRKD